MCKIQVVVFVLFFSLSCSSIINAQEKAKYTGYIEVEGGLAYNINPSQLISSNNLQCTCGLSSTHGVSLKNTYWGLGIGYYHSFRDIEDIYSLFLLAKIYPFKKCSKIYLESRQGVVYDSYWIETVQYLGALGVGYSLLSNLHLSCRASVFSRPSRFFTCNAALAISYAF